jgi:FdhE protein
MGPETIESLHRTILWFQEHRPIYTEMLTFFGAMFEAQFRAIDRVAVTEPGVATAVIEARKATRFPLIGVSEFTVDNQNAKELAATIIELARHSTPKLQEGAQYLMDAIGSGRLSYEVLFDMTLKRDDENATVEGDPYLLLFFGYHSLVPSILANRDLALRYLQEEEPWRTGYCPVCGGMPALSLLDPNGERSYVCSFCRNRWVVPRLFCAYCSNTNGETLEYIVSEEEPEYRIDTCLQCHRYVKTVDTRKTDRWIYPDVEMLTSIHLDMKAVELKLQPVVNNPYF